jgi:transcriptional regulator with XRE-family HTH domain
MGTRVRQLRQKHGWSQAELAKRTQLTRVYITRLEAGRYDPTLSTLRALAKAFEVTLAELLA